jgi:hypothetical protein
MLTTSVSQTLNRFFFVLMGCFLFAVSFSSFGQETSQTSDLAVRIFYQKPEDLKKLSSVVADHMKPDLSDSANPSVHAIVSPGELEKIKRMGFITQIDTKETARIGRFVSTRQMLNRVGRKNLLSARQISGENGEGLCYRTVEETFDSMYDLTRAYPQKAQVKTIGNNWLQTQPNLEGLLNGLINNTTSASAANQLRALLLDYYNGQLGNLTGMKVLVLGDKNNTSDKIPNVVTISGIHAREYAPPELVLRFAEWLLANDGVDPQATWLLKNVRFHFIVHANPAGRKMAEKKRSPNEYGGGWRKNINLGADGLCAVDPFSSGIDLNRNFPYTWNLVDLNGNNNSSGDICSAVYRGANMTGPYILEPEVDAMVSYITGSRPTSSSLLYEGGVLPNLRQAPSGDFTKGAPSNYPGIFLDIHSYSDIVIWPWGAPYINGNASTASQTANNTEMATIGQRIAYFNQYQPLNQFFYDTNGTTTDHVYGATGAPSLTLELGNSFYEDCSSFESSVLPDNTKVLLYVAKIAKAPYELSAGPVVTSLNLSRRIVSKHLGKVVINATVDDTPYKTADMVLSRPDPLPLERYITGAKLFVDTLPWEATSQTQVITLKPKKHYQSFGTQRTLEVEGVLNVSRLAPGKHLLYVQGESKASGEASFKVGAPEAIFIEVLK